MTLRAPAPIAAPADADDAPPTWEQYRAAIHQLVSASCCGGAHGEARPATPMGARGVLGTRGHRAWRAGVGPRAPLLPSERGPFVLPGVHLRAPGLAPTAPVDVLVEGDRLAAILPAGARTYPEAWVLEAFRGCFVSSALADLHTHMPPDNVFRLSALFLLLHLRHGITLVRDAGDLDGTALPAALALVESGALPGPEIRYTDAFVSAGPARWANTLRYDDPAAASDIVARLRHAGATWVKAYENLDVPRLRALAAAAAAAGLGVMGHVPTSLGHEQALLPDAQHLFGVPPPATLRRDHVWNRAIDWDGVDAARRRVVVDASRRHRLALTPTLSAHEGLLRLGDYAQEATAPDVALLPAFFAQVIWHPRHGLPAYRDIDPTEFARARRALDTKRELVGELAEAGVELRLGTDTQQPFVVPGSAMHRELAAMQRAGLDRAQAWRQATIGAGAVLSAPDFGHLAPGGRADLIVADGDPLAAGWEPTAIRAVVARGALMRREDLDRAIDRERRRFEGRIAEFTGRWLARFALQKAARSFVG